MTGLSSWSCQLVSWGSELQRGLSDISAAGLGYCEPGSKHLLPYERRTGEWIELLAGFNLRASAVFEFGHLANWQRRREIYYHHDKLAALMSRVGIDLVILGPGLRYKGADEGRLDMTIVTMLGEIFRRYQSRGIRMAVHPHYGQCIFTKREIDLVMDTGDGDIGLAVDTWHTAKAKIDLSKLLRQYAERVMCVHVKNGLYDESISTETSDFMKERERGKGFITLEFDKPLEDAAALCTKAAHVRSMLRLS